MSDNARFIHFNSEDVRESTVLNDSDIAFVKDKEYIETHGTKFGLLEWSEVPESEIPTNGLIARYSARGKSNSDTNRDTLEDLSGNGHDIKLYNFAYSGLSGYGGYVENYDAGSGRFNIHTERIVATKTQTSFHVTSVTVNNIIQLYYQSSGNQESFTVPSYKIRVSGLTDGQSIRYTGVVENVNGTLLTINSDGIYELPSFQFSAAGNVYGFTFSTVQDSCDITIEQLPLYPNALVSDGVDDYGLCENFPILTKENGYTIIARRKWLNIAKNFTSLLSKSPKSGQGEFIFEYDGNGQLAFNFGINSGITFREDLISYQTSKTYNGDTISMGDATEFNNNLNLFNVRDNNNGCQIALYDLLIYDHDLSAEEIAQVTNYLQSLAHEDEVQGGGIDYIDIWDTYGKSNSDEDRDKLVGKLNGLTFINYNFAYGGESGYGKYPINLSNLAIPQPDCVGERTDHKVHIIKQSGNIATLVCGISYAPSIKGTFRVTGLPTDNDYVTFRYYNSSDYSKNQTVHLYNGDNEVDMIPDEDYDSFYIHIAPQDSIAANSDLDVWIEALPKYSGALIYDGVDDYSRLDFASLEDQPEIGGMFILAKYLNEDYLSNRFILNHGSGTTEGRLTCYVNTNGIVVCGNPPALNVMDENNIISYTRDPVKLAEHSSMTLGGLVSNYLSNMALYELRLTRNKPTDQQVELIKADMLRKYNSNV